MLKNRIIPCLDVSEGRVVKGVNFVDLIDAGDPVEQAKVYNDQGADELCFLDITATSDNRNTILDVVSRTADQIFMPLTVGGGVRELQDIRNLLEAGTDKIAINSTAIKNPEFVREAATKCGNQCIVIAIDAKRVGTDKHGKPKWEIFTHGGRKETGIDALKWAQQMAEYGAGELLLTSMDRDGTKSGFDLELTSAVSNSVPIPVIASGGVGTIQHLVDGIKIGGASAVLAASIFHFGTFTIAQVKEEMAKYNIPIREVA